MVDRWIPVVAAILGVVDGMGGAYVGGSVANAGQQQRFESERISQTQNLRRATYVSFVRELEKHFFTGGTPDKARAAEASVFLVSSSAIRKAAEEATDAANASSEMRYTRARDKFIDLAQQELERAE